MPDEKKNQHRQTDEFKTTFSTTIKCFLGIVIGEKMNYEQMTYWLWCMSLTAFFSQTKQAKRGLKRRRHLLSATNTPKYENNSPQPSHFTAERYWCFHGIIKLPSPATAGQDFLLLGENTPASILQRMLASEKRNKNSFFKIKQERSKLHVAFSRVPRSCIFIWRIVVVTVRDLS